MKQGVYKVLTGGGMEIRFDSAIDALHTAQQASIKVGGVSEVSKLVPSTRFVIARYKDGKEVQR